MIDASELQPSVVNPIFLYEVTPSDGSVIAPTYKPMTSGFYTLGTLPYKSATSGEVPFYFSDSEWTDGQKSLPDLSLDFTGDSLPAGLTFTRSSKAWGWNKDKMLTEYAVNSPRVGMKDINGVSRGIWIEGQRTNYVSNSLATGAVVGTIGSGGLLPFDWYIEWGGSATISIIGTGVDSFGMSYIDFRLSGSTTTGPIIMLLEDFNNVIAAAGEAWTGSFYVKQVGGSQTNFTNFAIRVTEYNTPSDLVTNYSETSFTVDSIKYTRGVHTRVLTELTTNRATMEFVMYPVLNQPIDLTLRLCIPQLEKGPCDSSPILTSGTAVTRDADLCYMNISSSWYDSASTTLYSEFTLPSIAANTLTRTVLSLDDDTNNNGLYEVVIGSENRFQSKISSSLVLNLLYGTSISGYTSQRSAVRSKPGDWRAIGTNTGSSVSSSYASTPTVTKMRVGSKSNTFIDPLFGYVKLISFFKGLALDTLQDGLVLSQFYPPFWASGSKSTKENKAFDGRAEVPSLDKSIPLTPNAGNKAAISIGQIGMNNTDNYFDVLVKTYAVNGRKVNIKMLPTVGSQYYEAVSVFDGVGVSWVPNKDKMDLRVREKGFNLDVPMLSIFGGTGSGDGGTANIGHSVPQAYGICRNIVAELVDSSKLIYKFHDRTAQDVIAVYDRGAPITKGNSYANYAALFAATTTAGTFDYCLSSSGSYYRLGSSPSGSVTADVNGDAASGYVDKVGSILKAIMLRGVLLSELDTATFTALDILLPYSMGYFFKDQLNISEALDRICSGTFTFWGDIGSGLIGAYQISDPSVDTPDFYVDEFVISGEVEEIDLPDEINPSVWRVTVSYRNNWNPMSGTDIVPSPTITEARRKELQDGSLNTSVAMADRRIKDLMSIDFASLTSLYDTSAGATSYANMVLSMFSPGRQMFKVPLGIAGYYIGLNDTIVLKWPRFGLDNGKRVKVIGVSYSGRETSLVVFG